MTISTPVSCPACGVSSWGNFCATCGASLVPRTCNRCRASLSPQARFCHRCGSPVAGGRREGGRSDRVAWIVAGTLCVLLVGGIAYQVSRAAPQPVTPDMANAGASTGEGTSTAALSGRAPDISQMSPRERFDRLFNRIMQAAQAGDSAQVERFTPMALGAYEQLDKRDVDARYHAAVLYMQIGDFLRARALADTMLKESPGHLFAYLVRGTVARLMNDSLAEHRAQQDFMSHYRAETAARRMEYLEHQPVLDEFRREAERTEKAETTEKTGR